MRVRPMVFSLGAVLGTAGGHEAADAQGSSAQYVCRAVGGDNRRHISGPITMPVQYNAELESRLLNEFRAHIESSTGSVDDSWCTRLGDSGYSRYVESLESSVRRFERREPVRINWARDYTAAPPDLRTPLRAERAPGVYIMPPTVPGTQPIDSVRTSEAERQAIAERYRQQEREIAERNAREAAAHQARIAEADRRNAAHQAAMAESARQQEEYRRTRAQWEADTARCRAARSCASPQ